MPGARPSPATLRPYAGRWVAYAYGRVVGVGATAEAARLAAQLNRPKERPEVIYVPETTPLAWPAEISRLWHDVPANQRAALWLVGGCVRDVLLNRRIHDVDVVAHGEALRVARAWAERWQAAFYPLDAERGVGRVILTTPDQRLTLDFATLRGDSLEADLRARDFTINAMAASLTEPEALIDPLNGLRDLRGKLIRACSPTALSDDPVRGVRAVRLAAQLDFKLDKDTRALIRASASALPNISAERRRDEFIKCLGGQRPAAALRALDLLGLLDALVPEARDLKGVAQSAPHVYDVWEHTLMVITRLAEVIALLGPVHDVDAASDLTLGLISVRLGRYRHQLTTHLNQRLSGDRPARWILMLAALLHDIGKPATRSESEHGRIHFWNHPEIGAEIAAKRLTRLRFSADEIKRARLIVAHHMRPLLLANEPSLSRRAIYRYFRDTDEAGVEIVLNAIADYLGTHGDHPPPQAEWAAFLEVCARLLEAYFEKPAEAVRPPALVSGHDLIEQFGLESGPRLGQLLEALREAQATGEAPDREAALAFVRKKLAEGGL
jgi:putative nucleotidyltransferase with HDIG domain